MSKEQCPSCKVHPHKQACCQNCEDARIEAAVATERERCAVIAETKWATVSVGKARDQAEYERHHIVSAIRNGEAASTAAQAEHNQEKKDE